MIVNNTHIIFISANIRTCIGLRSLQRIEPTLTIQIHLTMERPSPDKAPHRPAIVLNRQIEHKNPIQLKKKATVMKSASLT